MTQFISTKQLYANLKKVSEAVQKGTVFIVLKHSQPVYKIVPFTEEDEKKSDNYQLKDISKFIFESKNKNKNLCQNYKKYLY